MSDDVRVLEPKGLWTSFADLNAVPRPSKKEERVIRFMEEFGAGLGLSTHTDEVGNVIIKKPATPGMENRKTVILQSHLDMVHQKSAETVFDFENQGIEMVVDQDWVRARGTTLGADNGIGVATIMALLASKDIPHPALEGLFTIDEETGMTGAKGLKGGLLDGSVLLNLDTEEDHAITIGCAGGVDVTASGTYDQEELQGDWQGYRISVKGLTSGHSGMEIHHGRANANKLMNRLLLLATDNCDFRLASVNGGGLRNAIAMESFAVVAVKSSETEKFEELVLSECEVIAQEYAVTDPDLEVTLEECPSPALVANADFQAKILRAIYSCPNGVYRMSPEIKDLVQTSNNLSRVVIQDGSLSVQCLTRSSVDSEKMDLAKAIKSAFELAGAEVEFSADYPGWEPKAGSEMLTLLDGLYKELFSSEPTVEACHAGLECGILRTNYPDIDMISFGPNITGAHTPEEAVQISSVQKYWRLLLETLQRIPSAN